MMLLAGAGSLSAIKRAAFPDVLNPYELLDSPDFLWYHAANLINLKPLKRK